MTFFLIRIIINLVIGMSSYRSCQTDIVLVKPHTCFSEVKIYFQQEESKYQYIGAEKCASVCHNNDTMGFQYDNWKTSLHSKAFIYLASKRAGKYAKNAHIKVNPQESAVCLKCHTTGGDLDSSYFSATYKKEEGVTCEACHKHKIVSKSYLPDEGDCLKCHKDSVHKIQKFDFKGKRSKIKHQRPAKITPAK